MTFSLVAQPKPEREPKPKGRGLKRGGKLARKTRMRKRKPGRVPAFWTKRRAEVIHRDNGQCFCGGPARDDGQVAHLHGLGPGGGARLDPDATCPNCSVRLNDPDNLRLVCGPSGEARSGRSCHADLNAQRLAVDADPRTDVAMAQAWKLCRRGVHELKADGHGASRTGGAR